MKDLHSHLLFGIDDGSKSLDETINLLREMEKSGVTELMLTPHYIVDSKYNCNNKDKKEIFDELEKVSKDLGIKIKLYLGNEVFFTTDFLKLIEEDKIMTLNGSKYLLFEFPMRQIYHNTNEIINELVSRGYVPVLAHPERYDAIQKHPNLVEEYLRSGMLLQCNYTSLLGKYGPSCKKTIKYFLKNKWVTFLGSDTHHDVNFKEEKVRKKLLRITKDSDYVDDLLENNFDKVVNNVDIGMLR